MSDIKKIERDGCKTIAHYEDGQQGIVIHASEEAAEAYAGEAETAKPKAKSKKPTENE